MATSLLSSDIQCRVSSVLNRDAKQFGKKHLLDGDVETSWNSDEGSPQWLLVEFPKPVRTATLQLQFQGGFVGKGCWLEGSMKAEHFKKIMDFYPEDINAVQSFPVPGSPVLERLRVVFSSSTDFFGRVVVYQFDMLGEVV
uniref:nuclear receptor 2C2-associated protein n=1 Tax=Myxine glutinosa TaxID=7769 RepID=UPI00358FFBC4